MFGAIRNLNAELQQFRVPAVNPATWAVLHRLRGTPSFKGFIAARQGLAAGSKELKETEETYINSRAKYNPSTYGGGHTWKRNEVWLGEVRSRKVVLTEIPLRPTNIMSGVDESGQSVASVRTGRIGKPGQVSAYGREIAYFLGLGYVCLLGDAVPGVPNGAYVMVPPGALRPAMIRAIMADRHVDQRYMARVAADGRISEDAEGTMKLLRAFAVAGLPTEPAVTAQEQAQLVKQGRDEGLAREKAMDAQAAAEDRRAEMRAAAVGKRATQRAEASKVVVPVHVLADWLVPRLKALGCDRLHFFPSGEGLKTLVAEAIDNGMVGENFSNNSMKDFIKEYVQKGRLPEPEKK